MHSLDERTGSLAQKLAFGEPYKTLLGLLSAAMRVALVSADDELVGGALVGPKRWEEASFSGGKGHGRRFGAKPLRARSSLLANTT